MKKLSLIVMMTFSLSTFSKMVTADKDYSNFYARVTDRNDSGNVLKVSTENRNIKLFRAGDPIQFTLTKKSYRSEYCNGYVRDVEQGFFVFAVNDFKGCFGTDNYLRRGTLLKISSGILAKRIRDAEVYREVLFKRKKDFLSQLDKVNQFLWGFKQVKVQTMAKFDEQLEEVKKDRQKELNFLNLKRKDYLHLQRELRFRLDELDKNIELYRVEKVKVMRDRYIKDHDEGKAFLNRPTLKAEHLKN